ncbi:MAG: hypothetical protein ACTH8F_08710 [Microbacterium sp.]|uniref:hypothetical protein n=1 Tax=Microbacterium sp. TaxID=51671 RepID=UPI003F943BC4
MWFKVDDRLGSSRKVLAIRRGLRLQAMGLWSLAGAWTAGEELDGFVPDYMVEEIGGDADLAAALVASGLWHEVDGGWQFVKWAEWQPTRDALEAKREVERERKAEWRRKKDEKRSVPEAVPLGQAEDERGLSQRVSPVASRGTPEGTDVSVPKGSALPEQTRPEQTRADPSFSKEKEELSSAVAVATPRPDVERLLDVLESEVVSNGGKAPARNGKNRDAMRLLLDKDGRSVEQVEAAIRWCQADEFWRANILSASKLREKFDQLRLAAQRRPSGASRAVERQQHNLSVVARFAAMDEADRLGLEP